MNYNLFKTDAVFGYWIFGGICDEKIEAEKILTSQIHFLFFNLHNYIII